MYQQFRQGWIEVISGCMFAGKTEELIRRITVLGYAKKNIVVFKPRIDDRYSVQDIASHSGQTYRSVLIDKASDILEHINDKVEVVAIDEAQFFDLELVKICEDLALKHIRVIVAGLDADFRGVPFPVMSELLVRAEMVTKLTAVCVKCGSPATKTQRIINGVPAYDDDPIILVGANESYEPRCRHCHEVLHRGGNK